MALSGLGFQCRVTVNGTSHNLQSDGTLGVPQFQFASPSDLAAALKAACDNETGTANSISIFKTPA